MPFTFIVIRHGLSSTRLFLPPCPPPHPTPSTPPPPPPRPPFWRETATLCGYDVQLRRQVPSPPLTPPAHPCSLDYPIPRPRRSKGRRKQRKEWWTEDNIFILAKSRRCWLAYQTPCQLGLSHHPHTYLFKHLQGAPRYMVASLCQSANG